MFYYENRTTKEIAERLNCTVGKVKVILHRVRKEIRKNLEDGGKGLLKNSKWNVYITHTSNIQKIFVKTLHK